MNFDFATYLVVDQNLNVNTHILYICSIYRAVVLRASVGMSE